MEEIRITKSELCWRTHEFIWTDIDFFVWKKTIHNASKVDWGTKDINLYHAAMDKLIHKLPWETAMEDFQKSLTSPNGRGELYIEYDTGENGITETLYLSDLMRNAMENDCLDTVGTSVDEAIEYTPTEFEILSKESAK